MSAQMASRLSYGLGAPSCVPSLVMCKGVRTSTSAVHNSSRHVHKTSRLVPAAPALRALQQQGSRMQQRLGRPQRQMTVQAATGAVEGEVGKEAYGIRRLAWVSFWGQLSLAIVSAIVLFFTMSATNWGAVPPLPVLFTLFGVATSFISTFLSFGLVRTARKVIEGKATIQKENIASTLLANQQLNLWGIGSALIGLQATVGTLVAKVLTSSTQNPYQAAGQAVRTTSPTALDAFSVQACTNTILAHFASIVFSNWMQRVLLKPGKPITSGFDKPNFPDYTQKRGPAGSIS